jgi:transcription antitermination protein NusB
MSDEAATRAPGRRRSAARLAAVQALYQLELAGASVETVIAEFAHDGLRRDVELPLADVDDALFNSLVRGVSARRDELDQLIRTALTPDWPLERLESVLRATLRAGAYELLARRDVPLPVVISEYLEVGHAFFSGKEPGLINGVLDRLARTLRSDEPPRGEQAAR